jgi:polysaccharide deacetylase family protein (PEP-CTERM system associated)
VQTDDPVNVLSFDIEEHWRSYESRGLAGDRRHDHDLVVIDRILSALANHHQRATFFVLASFAESEPSLVRRIIDGGHELASHGYSHWNLSRHTLDSFREDTRRSKRILEDIAGRSVVGYRAAQWSLMPRTAWMLPILLDLGFTYDSSAFPGRIHRFGWPGMVTWPHRRNFADGRSIVEVPGARIGFGSLAVQGCGGLYWRALPNWLHERSHTRGRCWYFHPYDLDPGYPLPADLPWQVRCFKSLGTGTAWMRFQALLARRKFHTCSDVLSGASD